MKEIKQRKVDQRSYQLMRRCEKCMSSGLKYTVYRVGAVFHSFKVFGRVVYAKTVPVWAHTKVYWVAWRLTDGFAEVRCLQVASGKWSNKQRSSTGHQRQECGS